MALTDTIWLRQAGANHRRSVHCSWLSPRGGSECFKADGRHHGCCSFETSTHDGSSNFDFNNISLETHAAIPHQPHAKSECSSNAFDHT